MMNIAINGFGRIGRNFLRTILLDPTAAKRINVAAINIGPADLAFTAYMFKYDTLMHTFPGRVELQGNELVIDDRRIALIAERDPLNADWKRWDIEWVVESSGAFTYRDGAAKHLQAGARAVLITAPATGEDITIVPGVNEDQFNNSTHTIVSLASCTTNAFVPTLKVLHDAFTITQGAMTTTHAYTNSQVLLDVEGEDKRRSRAAALNIIPTTSGASKMLQAFIPDLASAIMVNAIRVPVAVVSLIDFSFFTKKTVSIDAIHQAFERVAQGRMKGVLSLTMEPLVSSDFAGNPHSVVIDGLLTAARGNMGKVFGWYDNEWGYSERLKDFLLYVQGK